YMEYTVESKRLSRLRLHICRRYRLPLVSSRPPIRSLALFRLPVPASLQIPAAGGRSVPLIDPLFHTAQGTRSVLLYPPPCQYLRSLLYISQKFWQPGTAG